MIPGGLIKVWFKTERAKKHLDELSEALRDYRSSLSSIPRARSSASTGMISRSALAPLVILSLCPCSIAARKGSSARVKSRSACASTNEATARYLLWFCHSSVAGKSGSVPGGCPSTICRSFCRPNRLAASTSSPSVASTRPTSKSILPLQSHRR
jgi:hypothetical protein